MVAQWMKSWKLWFIVAAIAIIVSLVSLAIILLNGENAAARRQALIEDQIELYEEMFPTSYPEGSITYADDGNVIEITRVQADADINTIGEMDHIEEDQIAADSLALATGSPVIVYDRISEGVLFAIQVGFSTKDMRNSDYRTNPSVADKIAQAIKQAEELAVTFQDSILKARCKGIIEEESFVSDAQYENDDSNIWMHVVLKQGYTIRENRDSDGYDKALEYWEATAKQDARLIQKPIGYRFYSSDGELVLEVQPSISDLLISTHQDLSSVEST